jgi:hypothetical protein
MKLSVETAAPARTYFRMESELPTCTAFKIDNFPPKLTSPDAHEVEEDSFVKDRKLSEDPRFWNCETLSRASALAKLRTDNALPMFSLSTKLTFKQPKPFLNAAHPLMLRALPIRIAWPRIDNELPEHKKSLMDSALPVLAKLLMLKLEATAIESNVDICRFT